MLRRLPDIVLPRRRCRTESAIELSAENSLFPLSDLVKVADRQPHYRDQIGRRPVAVHESLAHADIAPKERAPVEAFVMDDQHRPDVGVCRTKAVRVLGTDQFQKPFFDATQEFQEKALG